MSDVIHGLHHADSFEVLKHLPDNYVDTIATDPPYGLVSTVKRYGKENSAPAKHSVHARGSKGFMGKAWDGSGIEYNVDFWKEALRVCKPGAQVFSFGGSRTYHRMATAMEAAGFVIFDMILWIYGTGYAKGRNVGADMKNKHGDLGTWDGWKTGLKPAHEPIARAIKPLDCRTYAENVSKWGTGAINIKASKIGADLVGARASNLDGIARRNSQYGMKEFEGSESIGRYPSNVIFSHSPDCFIDGDYWDCPSACPVLELDRQSGITRSPVSIPRKPDPPAAATWSLGRSGGVKSGYDDEGGASRFFYIAKPSQVERNIGLHDFESKTKTFNGTSPASSKEPKDVEERFTTEVNNIHPTVKPIEIMRYLIRLGTRPGGLVLDPFLGSGTTAIACVREGMEFIGIEKDEEYHAIAEARIVEAWEQRRHFESIGLPPEQVEESEYTALSGARMSDREARKKSLTPRLL